MVERVSALSQVYRQGQFGNLADSPGVRMAELRGCNILQVAAWPETLETVRRWLASETGVEQVPGPGRVVRGEAGVLARVEPLGWWLLGFSSDRAERLLGIDPDQGVALDISHSRTVIRIRGQGAEALLNRFLSIDLSETAFPPDSVVTGLCDHLPATVMCGAEARERTFDFYIGRTYAQFMWEELCESAGQFGLAVEEPIQA